MTFEGICIFTSFKQAIAIAKSMQCLRMELLNNKLHGLLPPGGLVPRPGAFASLWFDQNAICILHQSDCAWLCCLSSQLSRGKLRF